MVFKFGKYKGYKLADVERTDPGYIRWAKQNAPNLIPKRPVRSNDTQELKELDELEDAYKLRTLRTLLLINPGKPEDAF